MTAVGGFIFDPSGNGRGDVTVRVYSAPPSGDRCGTYAYNANNYVASYTTGSDGFYFIWQKGDNNNPASVTNNLASGLKYYIALCDDDRWRHGDAVRPAVLAGPFNGQHARQQGVRRGGLLRQRADQPHVHEPGDLRQGQQDARHR